MLRQLQELRLSWLQGLVGKPGPLTLAGPDVALTGEVTAVDADTVSIRTPKGRVVKVPLALISAGDVARGLGVHTSAPPEGEDAVRAYAWLVADDAAWHAKTEARMRGQAGAAGLPWVERRAEYEALLATGRAAARLESRRWSADPR